MSAKKRLLGRKTNRYFNYRIGAYSEKRSLWSFVFLPIFSMLILGSLGTMGYVYYQRQNVVLSAENKTPVPSEIKALSQEQIDQKAFQAREDQSLVKTIQEKIDQMPQHGEWQVSLRDLKSGRMANINSDTVTPAASLYKLFLLAPLEKKISADNWKSFVGKQSINDCVTAMIKVSDNDCPLVLANYANWKNIDPHNQSLGFKNTRLNKDGNQLTTARETAELMYRLQNSQILSDKARRLVFDGLYEQKYRQGIPNGCGSECLVANKTGDIGEYRHDAAIVTHGSSKYVLVIMTKNATWPQIADLASAIDREMLP